MVELRVIEKKAAPSLVVASTRVVIEATSDGPTERIVTRYDVAASESSEERTALQAVLESRRNFGRIAPSKVALIGAVAQTDEFAALCARQHPTMDNRAHYAMTLRASGFSPQEAHELAYLEPADGLDFGALQLHHRAAR